MKLIFESPLKYETEYCTYMMFHTAQQYSNMNAIQLTPTISSCSELEHSPHRFIKRSVYHNEPSTPHPNQGVSFPKSRFQESSSEKESQIQQNGQKVHHITSINLGGNMTNHLLGTVPLRRDSCSSYQHSQYYPAPMSDRSDKTQASITTTSTTIDSGYNRQLNEIITYLTSKVEEYETRLTQLEKGHYSKQTRLNRPFYNQRQLEFRHTISTDTANPYKKASLEISQVREGLQNSGVTNAHLTAVMQQSRHSLERKENPGLLKVRKESNKVDNGKGKFLREDKDMSPQYSQRKISTGPQLTYSIQLQQVSVLSSQESSDEGRSCNAICPIQVSKTNSMEQDYNYFDNSPRVNSPSRHIYGHQMSNDDRLLKVEQNLKQVEQQLIKVQIRADQLETQLKECRINQVCQLLEGLGVVSKVQSHTLAQNSLEHSIPADKSHSQILFSVNFSAVIHKQTQQCCYNIDSEGYLLDANCYYILNQQGCKIKLGLMGNRLSQPLTRNGR